MKLRDTLWSALVLIACASSFAQGSRQSLDHIQINDPRVFDLSDSGNGYHLDDGPVTTATLKLIQGGAGNLVGSLSMADDHGNSWQDIGLSGRLKVSGTTPLSLKLTSTAKGIKVVVAGTYDASVRLMRIQIQVKAATGEAFQWNDSFVPEGSESTGFSLDRESSSPNGNGSISGTYAVSVPGALSWSVGTRESQLNSSDYRLKGKGVSLYGDYNVETGTSAIYQAKFSVGYGTIFTPGSLVTVTSDEDTSNSKTPPAPPEPSTSKQSSSATSPSYNGTRT